MSAFRVSSRREVPTAPGRRAAGGFTLIEMLVVMTLIALLLGLAAPHYFQSVDAGRVKVQQQDLAVMRDAIDKFFGDQGRYPDSLAELATKRYLRTVPVDPVTNTSAWTTVAPTDGASGQVFDVQPPVDPNADAVPAP